MRAYFLELTSGMEPVTGLLQVLDNRGIIDYFNSWNQIVFNDSKTS